MLENPLVGLNALGQSVWLDFIDRDLLASGRLTRLIEDDGLAGLTSNPTIFERAIGESHQYDDAIRSRAQAIADTKALYEALALEDVRAAADRFASLYRTSRGRDGYVSLEVSPHLADEAGATVREAQRLWSMFDRPNAMIKVPGTKPGLAAIRELLARGVNVNVTLLFSPERYREVVEAFTAGLEARTAAGKPVDHVASVASFFLSRIDTLVDGRLDALGDAEAHALRGRAAIACAKLAYQYFRSWTATERWQRLAQKGARPQRLLWASTSTKDPTYSDTKYVDALIGADTVTTLPPDTLAAYRAHGRPQFTLEEDMDGAAAIPSALRRLQIDLQDVGAQLEREGVRKFIEPFDKLLASLERRRRELRVGTNV